MSTITKEIDITSIRYLFGKVVNTNTEQYFIINFKIPNLGEVIDRYIKYLEDKYGYYDLESLTKLSTTLEYIILTNMEEIDKYLLSVNVKKLYNKNNKIYILAEGVYDD